MTLILVLLLLAAAVFLYRVMHHRRALTAVARAGDKHGWGIERREREAHAFKRRHGLRAKVRR